MKGVTRCLCHCVCRLNCYSRITTNSIERASAMQSRGPGRTTFALHCTTALPPATARRCWPCGWHSCFESGVLDDGFFMFAVTFWLWQWFCVCSFSKVSLSVCGALGILPSFCFGRLLSRHSSTFAGACSLLLAHHPAEGTHATCECTQTHSRFRRGCFQLSLHSARLTAAGASSRAMMACSVELPLCTQLSCSVEGVLALSSCFMRLSTVFLFHAHVCMLMHAVC